MGDENALVDSLRGEIERLNKRNSELSGEVVRRKDTLRALCQSLGVTNNAELKQLVEDVRKAGPLKQVLSEHATLKEASTAEPSDWQRKYEEARDALRSFKHRDGFKALYADEELGLRPDVPVERLMGVLGYKAETEEFDAAAVKSAVAQLKTSDPYLFGAGSSAGDQSPTTSPPWGGRGATDQPVGGVIYTEAQLRDPVFMLAQAAKRTG